MLYYFGHHFTEYIYLIQFVMFNGHIILIIDLIVIVYCSSLLTSFFPFKLTLSNGDLKIATQTLMMRIWHFGSF